MNYGLSFLKNKKIAFLGLGIENLALARYLLKQKVKCELTICDARNDINRSGLTKAKVICRL